ncbi:MAG: serine hydrolase [Polyangiaceae bacterium]|nr:serine hydrolase [Polyangiaceae bacterium]
MRRLPWRRCEPIEARTIEAASERRVNTVVLMRWVLALSFLLVGCVSRVLQLHPFTGDTFTIGEPVEPRGKPLGPFSGDETERFAQLLERWRPHLDRARIPGGAIAIVLDGHLRLSAGIGVREAGHDAPVTATTRFRTASITKMLMAAAILTLAADGLVALDAPVTRYLPSFTRAEGDDPSAVTLEMLLTHSDGLGDIVHCPDGASLAETFAMHERDHYWAPPGRLFDYSNFDYALLAAVIEQVTGRRFEDVVVERMLAPSGMRTASFEADVDDEGARGHLGGRVVWTHPVDCEASRAAGGVIASVQDFAHFTEVLLAGGGGVLSSSAVTAMTTGRVRMQTTPLSRYGYGIVEREHAGLRTLEHGGFAYGMSSIVRIVPSRGFAVVAFANGPMQLARLANAAESAFLGVTEEPDAPSPATRLEDYVGVYDDPFGWLGRFEVFLDGRALRARFEHPRGPIPGQLAVEFERDANGVVEYAVTRNGIGRRVAE